MRVGVVCHLRKQRQRARAALGLPDRIDNASSNCGNSLTKGMACLHQRASHANGNSHNHERPGFCWVLVRRTVDKPSRVFTHVSNLISSRT